MGSEQPPPRQRKKVHALFVRKEPAELPGYGLDLHGGKLDSNPDSDHLSHVDCDPDSNPDSGPGARVNAPLVSINLTQQLMYSLSLSYILTDLKKVSYLPLSLPRTPV